MDKVSQAPLILITGGSRGVGAATARLAAAQGYDVAISYVANEPAALEVVADIEALGRKGLAVRADSADPSRLLNCSRPRSIVHSGVSTFWSITLAFWQNSHAWRT